MESYLKEKAILHERKHISRTYLLFTDDNGPKPVAYFSIAVSCMEVNDLECSNGLRKKLNINKDIAQSYLIGQIGKCDGTEKGLGERAIEIAIDLIADVNSKVGCRVIRVDCKDVLIDYYRDNGFRLVRRNKDGDLNQMVQIID